MAGQDAAGDDGSKVSYQVFYTEILRLEGVHEKRGEKMAERIDRLRTETLDRMDRMRAESADRAATERAVLDEIRDSTGALHAVMGTLPCDAHGWRDDQIAADIAQVKSDVAEIKAQLVNWKWMWSWINRRTMAAIIGTVAGLVGWDGAQNTIREWVKFWDWK